MATMIKVEVNLDNLDLPNLVNSILDDSVVMTRLHQLLAKMCDPYVPFLEGPLSQSGLANVSSEGVLYSTPYAHYQYEGIYFNHTLDYHPLASARWDEAMMNAQGEEFDAQVRDILIARINEIYG